MSELRRYVREQVSAIRDGTAEGCGEMVVRETHPPRHAMQGNARRPAGSPGAGHFVTHDEEEADDRSAVALEAQLKPLTVRQQTAINLITMGKSIVATARSIKVDPATIHRWKASNPQFAAELNRRQAAIFDSMVIKLRLTMERAVDELHAIVTGPSKRERAEAMWKLLPMLKPQRLIMPAEPTSAAAVIDEQIRQERAQRGEVVEAEITNAERLEHVRPEDRATPTAPPNAPPIAPPLSTPPAPPVPPARAGALPERDGRSAALASAPAGMVADGPDVQPRRSPIVKQGAQRQSVVGMFDDRADAMRAQAAIRSAGIAEVDVNLLPADEVGPQGLTDEEFARYKEAIHFLFATGADDEADLYVEALRRGATLVTATTDDASRVDELRAILKRCNAVDLAGRKDQLSTPARSATPAEVAADKAKG